MSEIINYAPLILLFISAIAGYYMIKVEEKENREWKNDRQR